ncbi:DUF6350 family protein [Jonesiaceae bacterium BS-20]|uniref:DUF6350 family protein n=1 Tax=Jonesiaceae bacterium BS-20 TaxID=3120821 RepID=A0AAU7DVG5_9MICO
MSLSGGYRPPNAQGKIKPAGRVIEDRESLREQLNAQRSSIDGVPWVSGLVAAVQSLVFGLAIILIPVLTTAAISTTLVDQDFAFGPSFMAGLRFWALGHGGQEMVQGSAITLIPLGLTIVLILAGSLSVRRTVKPGYDAAGWYAGSYLLIVLALSAAVGAVSGGSFLSILVTTLIIAVASLALGLRKRLDAAKFREQLGTQLGRPPVWLRIGVRMGSAALALVLLIAGVVLAGWFMLGMDNMAEVLGQWSLDAPSGIAMGAAQLALVPNLLLWAAAWSSGTNFAVGQDTMISLTQTELGPLPALPMLGALPSAPAWPILHNLLPILLVLVCAAAGMIFARHRYQMGAWQMLGVLVSGVGTVFVGFMILYWLGSGAAGPHRLSEVGVNPLSGAGQLALLSGIGFVLVTLLMRPEVRQWTKHWWGKAMERATRVDDLDFVPAQPDAQAESVIRVGRNEPAELGEVEPGQSEPAGPSAQVPLPDRD